MQRHSYLSDTGLSLEYIGPIDIEIANRTATEDILDGWRTSHPRLFDPLFEAGLVEDDGSLTEAGLDEFMDIQKRTLQNILAWFEQKFGAEIVTEELWWDGLDGLNLSGQLYDTGGYLIYGWLDENASTTGTAAEYIFDAEAMAYFIPDDILIPIRPEMIIEMGDDEPEDEWQEAVEDEWTSQGFGTRTRQPRGGPGIRPR